MGDLVKSVGSFWTNQAKSGHTGLVLLDACIQHTIKHRDSDALARFLARAVASNAADAQCVKRIIRAAFGDMVTYKKDTDHPSGGKFTLKWGAQDAFVLRNSYGVVAQAIADHKSFRAGDLQGALKKQEGKPEATAKADEDAAKALAAYVMKQVKLGNQHVDLMFDLAKKMVRDQMAKVVVVKLDGNGEPAH